MARSAATRSWCFPRRGTQSRELSRVSRALTLDRCRTCSCPFCKNAKAALDAQGIAYKAIELDARADGQQIQDIMLQMTGARSVPRVFVNGKFVGGGDDTCALAASGKLKALVEAE